MAAQTYLCYGIAVTNESLTYATMAHEKLDGPLRFIQLVQNRIREGRLQAKYRQAVAYLPIEIWDLVRHKVVDLELRIAERNFVNSYACDGQRDCDCCILRSIHPPPNWTELTRTECERCFLNIYEYQGFQDDRLSKKCRTLLKRYQLDMPSTTVIQSVNPDFAGDPNGDPDAIAFIALPSSPIIDINSKDHPSYEQPPVDQSDQYRNDGIWNISLEVPPRADERFRRLLHDLHLQPLQVEAGTIGLARAMDAARKCSYKKISTGEAKPRWQLFTTVVRDW
ncbi:hypothetical protein JCM10908_003029 [Rhodotorula pacifica]|uniref:uncharacterized protein n=1 Tax=Rhodotorula pacifica TaxID=1495444 RepID=UPI00316FDE07